MARPWSSIASAQVAEPDGFGRAVACMQSGRLVEAERLCREILKATRSHFDAQHLLALVRHQQGHTEEAAKLLARALKARPDAAIALSNHGLMLHALSRHEQALASVDKALAIEPDYVEALYNRGAVLDGLGRHEDAVESYRRALAIRPDHAGTLNNLGIALDELGRHEEALASYDKALALRPDYADALNNRGTALVAAGRFDEALASYDRALALWPDYVECRLNRSMLLRRLSSFAQGWRDFESRRMRPSCEQRNFSGPEWTGGAAAGKRLLFYAEQGLGDTIQFSRFAHCVAADGAEVVLEVQRPLAKLIGTLKGVTVIGKGQRPPAIDGHLPLMSLPHMLGTTVATIPARVPYLAADPARVAAWAKKLPRDCFKVGVVWQGNPNPNVDKGRSIPLREFAPLAGIPGITLVSLQKNEGVEQLSSLPSGMDMVTLGKDFDAGPDAFLDSAAVLMTLDLLVSSDTAMAHLAGALARPVWIALKRVPDWRFMTDREDTPWYPTARLFRQRQAGDWAEVFARMAAELAKLVGR